MYFPGNAANLKQILGSEKHFPSLRKISKISNWDFPHIYYPVTEKSEVFYSMSRIQNEKKYKKIIPYFLIKEQLFMYIFLYYCV